MPSFSLPVLIVDDDTINQEVLALLLKDLDYPCETADDGRQALEKVMKTRFGLVFMDCHMPVMDGLQAAAKIREAEKAGLRHVTIIALTADDTPEDREKCRAAGMDDYLVKPFTSKKLAEVLSRWDRPIDPFILKDFYRVVGEERFHSMAEAFGRKCRQEISALSQAVDASDWDSVRELTHQLKGKSATFGGARIETICVQMEKFLAEPSQADFSPLIRLLSEELDSYQTSLAGLLSAKGR